MNRQEETHDLTDSAIAALVADLNGGTHPVTPAIPEFPVELIESNEVEEVNVEAASDELPATEVDAKAVKAAEKLAVKEARAVKKAEAKAATAVKAQAKKDAKAVKDAEKKATKEAAPTKPVEKRIYFADRADRIKHRLGVEFGNFMVWEVGDATLTGADLEAKQTANFAIVKGLSKKVKNRAGLLLDFCAGKTDSLNSVISIAFKLLSRDGRLTTGDKGSYIGTLLVKDAVNPRPYSLNAARAMGNNSLKLLKELKVLKAGEGDQIYIANPDSLIHMMVKVKLSLA